MPPAVFSVWLLSLSVTLLKFAHAVGCISISFLLLPSGIPSCGSVTLYVIYSPADGRGGCFQFGVIMIKTAMRAG